MSTPAEIIAARVLNAIENKDEVSDYEESGSFADDEINSIATSVPSISDETAFPTLGGAKKPNYSSSTTIWGPDAESGKSSTGTFSKSVSPLPSGKFKASSIQEAFSLDADDQLNVARPEFIKILTSIKKDTKTNIECTTSQHTKKRTFLISGKSEDVKLAKRLVIKKLTKPVSIIFTVPAQLRSKIIGPQGRTLKPIIQSNEVKIDIGNTTEVDSADSDSDDIFSRTVTVTISGDVEGCKRAKSEILFIIKEETKNLVATLTVDADVKALAEGALKDVVENFNELEISIPDYKSRSSLITLSGERDSVLKARETIKQRLASLAEKIVIEEVPIPKVKHQFLLVDEILNEFNVFINIPEDDEPVKFVGEKKKISFAKEKARQTTSQYKVEVLDMSKAHKGNLKHVKAVASLLRSNGTLQTIANENNVSISSPSDVELSGDIASIPIQIVAKTEQVDDVKSAKKAIVATVNKISPDSTKVIDDIDSFLIPKVPELINEIASKNNISFVILGSYITLFASEAENYEEDDFVDSNESSTSFEAINNALQPLREMAADLENVILSASAEEQKIISGANNTTLNSVLKSVDPNTVVVKFSENDVSIYGLKKQVGIVKQEIQTVLNDYKEFKNNYATSVEVPRSVLSRLIGKNGSNMTALREEFGVKINVEDDKSSEASAKVEIALSGVKRNVEECKAQILSISKRWADESLARIKIDNQYHRRLIGANGIYINRLQDKYNVKIRFPSEKASNSNYADAPKSKDEVTIKGPSKGVAKAEEELKELYQFEKENGFQSVIQIPTKAIARVIGKAGETINDIADGTGVEYKFNRDNESEESLGYAEVTLTGSKNALKEASKKIQDIIDEIENFVSISINVDPSHHRSLIGQGGSVMKDIISRAGGDNVPRSKYFRLLTIPNEGSGSDVVTSEGDKEIVEKIIEEIKSIVAEREASVVVDYDIPKEKHRLIVGTAGSIRHSLQEEFKVMIDIPRPSDDSTVVKLRGLPERIEKLTEKLNELTKDDWNVSIDIPQQYHSLVSERGAIFKKLKSDFGVEVLHGNLTRKAAKLSSSPIPEIPESAKPINDEAKKFTIVANEVTDEDLSEVIPWRLKGETESTDKAAKLIQDRLENAKLSNSIGWFYSKNPSQFYKIVGSQGSKINQIRKNTNTFITIPRSTDKNPNYIYLVGTEENLKKAEKEIESLI